MRTKADTPTLFEKKAGIENRGILTLVDAVPPILIAPSVAGSLTWITWEMTSSAFLEIGGISLWTLLLGRPFHEVATSAAGGVCAFDRLSAVLSTVHFSGGRSPAPSIAPVSSVWLSDAILCSLAGGQSYSSPKCLQMLSYNWLSKAHIGVWGSLTFCWSGSKGLYWQPNEFPSMV